MQHHTHAMNNIRQHRRDSGLYQGSIDGGNGTGEIISSAKVKVEAFMLEFGLSRRDAAKKLEGAEKSRYQGSINGGDGSGETVSSAKGKVEAFMLEFGLSRRDAANKLEGAEKSRYQVTLLPGSTNAVLRHAGGQANRQISNTRLGMVKAVLADQVDVCCKVCGTTSSTKYMYDGKPVREMCCFLNKLTKKRCRRTMVCINPAEQSRTISRLVASRR